MKKLNRRLVSAALVLALLMMQTVAPFAQAWASEESDDMYAGTEDVSISDYPTLQLGDRDKPDSPAYIVMLQNRLIELGFLQDAADGIYGDNTRIAVEQFQKLNGMYQNGIADKATQTRIFSDVSALTTPSPDTFVVYGGDIADAQTMLARLGFLGSAVDGKSGTKTETAITDFKNYILDNDMIPEATPEPTPEPTPTPDPNAMPMVEDVPVVEETPEPTPYVANGEIDDVLMMFVRGDAPFKVYQRTVQLGDKGADVQRVQVRLKYLKYLYAGTDGQFGENTARALKYFQRKHGMIETGIADEATQLLLFSDEAQASEEYVFPYKLVVDISDQAVFVYAWSGEDYSVKDHYMLCSTGMDDSPTPLGTYQAYAQLNGEWYYFEEYECYAKWAYGIIGGILFHSVTFRDMDDRKVNTSNVKKLGKKASHGCVRLAVEDAKWIYDNCPYGTTVVIQE